MGSYTWLDYLHDQIKANNFDGLCEDASEEKREEMIKKRAKQAEQVISLLVDGQTHLGDNWEIWIEKILFPFQFCLISKLNYFLPKTDGLCSCIPPYTSSDVKCLKKKGEGGFPITEDCYYFPYEDGNKWEINEQLCQRYYACKRRKREDVLGEAWMAKEKSGYLIVPLDTSPCAYYLDDTDFNTIDRKIIIPKYNYWLLKGKNAEETDLIFAIFRYSGFKALYEVTKDKEHLTAGMLNIIFPLFSYLLESEDPAIKQILDCVQRVRSLIRNNRSNNPVDIKNYFDNSTKADKELDDAMDDALFKALPSRLNYRDELPDTSEFKKNCNLRQLLWISIICQALSPNDR